jgi:hypothetical protein
MWSPVQNLARFHPEHRKEFVMAGAARVVVGSLQLCKRFGGESAELIDWLDWKFFSLLSFDD